MRLTLRAESVRTCLIVDGDSGPALAFTRSLGAAGWRVIVPADTRCASSRFADEQARVVDAFVDPDGFRADVLSVLERRRVDAIVPTTDVSWEQSHRAVGRSAAIVGGVAGASLPLLDKAVTLRRAEAMSFPVPRWLDPRTAADVMPAALEIGLPCVVKPRRSYQVVDGVHRHLRHTVVASAAQAEAAGNGLTGDAGPPVVQALLEGRSLAVTAVIQHGAIVACIARETLTFYPLLGGTSVRRRTISMDEPHARAAADLLVQLGVDGLAEVEYQLCPDGVAGLMEIGPRPHGWIPLAVAAGVDVPRLAAEVAVGDEVAPALDYREGVEMLWPGGELHRLRDALSRSVDIPYPLTRRGVLAASWPPWRPGMRLDGISLHDPWPSLPRAVRGGRGSSRAES